MDLFGNRARSGPMKPATCSLGPVAGRRALFHAALAVLALNVTAIAQPSASGPCKQQSTVVTVTDFGAKGDDASDNVQAFRDAFAYAAQCGVATIHVPAGTYRFVPPGPAGGLLLGTGVSLVGDGADKTTLKVAAEKPGANFDSLLWIRNQDHVEIRGVRFVGSNIVVSNAGGQPLNSYGTAVSIVLDAEASSAANGVPRNLAHFVIADSSFENFNGAAWIRVINYHAAFSIDDVEVINNKFVSAAGNAVNAAAIAYTSNAISVTGSRTSPDGLVTHVRIVNNSIDAAHLKGGVAIWSGVRGALISDNRIVDTGADSAIPNDRGAYAITVYNSAYYYDKDHRAILQDGIRPDDVHVERNIILRPRSCGIYVASANRVWIVGNEISGQTDPENKTLPKGAIAMNHPMDATITGNRISASHIGMALLAGEPEHISESDNSVVAVPPGGYGILWSRGPPPTAH